MAQKLLERDAVLGRLAGLRWQAAHGAGRMVLLHGEAGVGKTAVIGPFLAGHDLVAAPLSLVKLTHFRAQDSDSLAASARAEGIVARLDCRKVLVINATACGAVLDQGWAPAGALRATAPLDNTTILCHPLLGL